jgi:hypothetical protein
MMLWPIRDAIVALEAADNTTLGTAYHYWLVIAAHLHSHVASKTMSAELREHIIGWTNYYWEGAAATRSDGHRAAATSTPARCGPADRGVREECRRVRLRSLPANTARQPPPQEDCQGSHKSDV